VELQRCERFIWPGAKSAYKQLARHPNDAWASILAAYDPASDAVKFFKADELASVTHGAVVYIPGRRKRLVFGDAVPRQFVDFWARNGKKQ
ncbi:unnamed protein product, partial [Effrenium voratum]